MFEMRGAAIAMSSTWLSPILMHAANLPLLSAALQRVKWKVGRDLWRLPPAISVTQKLWYMWLGTPSSASNHERHHVAPSAL